MEATKRLGEFLCATDVPFFVWLRFLTMQQLTQTHRRHLGVKARNAGREVSLDRQVHGVDSTCGPPLQFMCQLPSPSDTAIRTQRRDGLAEALGRLEPIDRNVLIMRTFEDLSNIEVAQILGISPAAASARLRRAIARLRNVLEELPGGLEQWD